MNLKTICVIALALSSASALAEAVRTDRYTLVYPTATAAELDPLSVNVKMDFPPTVKTVGDAVDFVLLNSGWQITNDLANGNALAITLKRPLPLVHRNMSLMPLRTALHTLVGSQYIPVEDPIRRIYSFDLKEEYRGLLTNVK